MGEAGSYFANPATRLPEIIQDPLEFLSRSWSPSALEVAKVLSPPTGVRRRGNSSATSLLEDAGGAVEKEATSPISGNSFTFACSATSQLVLERIMSQSQEVSQLMAGRLSHSGGPLNGGSLSDSPPVSPSDKDDYCRVGKPAKPVYRGGNKTVGRWLKDRRERRKEEIRALNAQVHAAVSVAGVAAAVAAVASATCSSASCKNDGAGRTNLAIASAATLVAAQCAEAAEALGAERDHLAAAIASAVSVRTPGDIATLTAAAATAVIPVEKGFVSSHKHGGLHSDGEAEPSGGELIPEENLFGLCTQEFLARGSELLKRTRKGALHWKMVSVYIHRTGQVKLKMKSRHVAGTITKKKKSVVVEVCKNIRAWPGRHLLVEGEERCYFGFKTAGRRVIEFECCGRSEFELWTKGVSRLLSIVAGNAKPAS
ncbi:hypothetical protein HPP92_024355 [Vanilla planifolia]|uniref:VAN3-binding protein n=1 Tax=Vanilla planifolia TaxID=51239 RepID=A0A835UBE2_VANPL|nr:hypothetical protein HPP92_024355 [Vanilla planifolia]